MKKWFGILMVSVFIVGLVGPAMAAPQENWTIYGDASVLARYITQDEDASKSGESETNFYMTPWDMADVGFKYKGERLEADFDIQMNDRVSVGAANATTALEFDAAWAMVKFDSVMIKAGKTGALSSNPIGAWRGKYGNNGYGVNIGGTNEYLIDFIFPVGKGMKFEVQLAGVGAQWASAAGANVKQTMPNLEVAFSAFTGFPWKVWGGYESYEVSLEGEYEDETLTSYTVGAVVRPKFGPVSLNATVNYDVNNYQTQGALPFYQVLGPGGWIYDPTENITKIGAGIGMEIALNKSWGIGAGAGYHVFSAEDGDNGKYEDPVIAYWINAKYNISQTLYIMPYFTVANFDKKTVDGTEYDQGSETEYGILWRVMF